MAPNVDDKGSMEVTDKETKFEIGDGLQPSTSIEEATLAELEDSRNGKFTRSFSPRQIHVSSTKVQGTSSRFPNHVTDTLI